MFGIMMDLVVALRLIPSCLCSCVFLLLLDIILRGGLPLLQRLVYILVASLVLP